MITPGIDIVSVKRFKRIVDRYGEGFLKKVFSKEEIENCKKKHKPNVHLAGRFAAKEAVVKALMLPRSKGYSLHNITICSSPEGVPGVELRGWVKDDADTRGISAVLISISHCDEYATAIAIAVENGDAFR